MYKMPIAFVFSMIVPTPLEKTLPLLHIDLWMDGSAASLSFHQWRQSPLKLHLARALNLDLILVVIRPRDVFHPFDWEIQVLPHLLAKGVMATSGTIGARHSGQAMLPVLYLALDHPVLFRGGLTPFLEVLLPCCQLILIFLSVQACWPRAAGSPARPGQRC